jgi:hypothetical protein
MLNCIGFYEFYPDCCTVSCTYVLLCSFSLTITFHIVLAAQDNRFALSTVGVVGSNLSRYMDVFVRIFCVSCPVCR